MKGVWLFLYLVVCFCFYRRELIVKGKLAPVLYYDKYVENRNKENHING